MSNSMGAFPGIPFLMLTDSYKISHPELYPNAQKMVAYGEFRKAYNGDKNDERIVFCGMRYIIETYVTHRWTLEEVDKAAHFFSTHGPGHGKFPFPRELFDAIATEMDGKFPVKIEALPEGSVCHPHVPVYQITAEGRFSRLVTFLETLLTMTWYPSTVATLSRRTRSIIERAYDKSVDERGRWTLESRLHDFGFRGCTSVEQAVLGGCANLLNFEGTDTLVAAYYAQHHLNGGKPLGTSIPASEHSVMTSFRSEREAILKLIDRFGEGVFACVMDSYDYVRALQEVLPSIADAKLAKGGVMILRPDSGDSVETVLQALRAADKTFGSDLNGKGYRLLRGMGVIQGDGVTYDSCRAILEATLAAGYSAENVAFGMGGGLMQKLNRDTMSFATKLSHITYADGETRDVMKTPKTDEDKFSLPGEFAVVRDPVTHALTVRPKREGDEGAEYNALKVVYDHGKVGEWEDFEQQRARLAREWSSVPPLCDPISLELRDKVIRVKREIRDRAGYHKE